MKIVYIYKSKQDNTYFKCFYKNKSKAESSWTPNISEAKEYLMDKEKHDTHFTDNGECIFIPLTEEMKNIRKRKLIQLQNVLHI